MKQNQEINVNRMLILLLSKTKQMMPERYSVHFLWREYFTELLKKTKRCGIYEEQTSCSYCPRESRENT